MTLDLPGFQDPVGDSQACFRAVLDATACPGSIHAVAGPPHPPHPLDRATAAALLTLVDGETPLWLDPAAAGAADWITFHCGAPVVPAAQAAYVVALGGLRLADFPAGTDDDPERAATIILQVQALGEGQALRLSGPGLEHPAPFAVAGLPDGFLADWAANHALFPRGVDVVLCAGDCLAAFPRTLLIEAA